MAGRGPAPKQTGRRTRHVPQRGDWQPTSQQGWQHGEIPTPPDGLKDATVVAWHTWFAAWFASHWTPDDLPGLRIVIGLYDQVERGEFTRATELRQLMDNYGITPKGQQDRRWQRPKEDEPSPSQQREGVDHYAHLKVVS